MRGDSLQLRLIGLMAGTIGLLVVPAFLGWLHVERAQEHERIASLGTLVAESMASELEYPISVGAWDAVADKVDLGRRPREIAYVVVEPASGPRVARVKSGPDGCRAIDDTVRCASQVVEVTRPVRAAEGADPGLFAEPGATVTSTLGSVRVGVGLAHSKAMITRHTQQVAAGVLIIALAVFLAAAGLARKIARAMAEQNARLAEAKDQALAASRLKSEFLANMSHEIRTPMNGVLGMANILAAQPLDDDARDIVDTIQGSATALLAIINDILDFSKIEAGKMDVERLPMDPEAIVDDVLDMMAGPAEAKGLELLPVVESALPRRIVADPTRFRQVVTNLVSNAIKFTTHGQVSVHLRVAETRLRIEVRDTGMGVSPSAQRYIFEPFRQADGSTTRRFGGTGLGLAIARQMVELMGGRIGVESELEKGSTFWFELPLSEEARAPEPLAVGPVLVVSDRPQAREALVKRLIAVGVREVEAVDAPPVALARRYAVVLADLRATPPLSLVELAAAAGSRLVVVGPRAGAGADTLIRPWRAQRLRTMLTVIEPALVVRRSLMPRSAPVPSVSPTHVLVVDDNVVNLKVATRMLTGCGCRVTACASGEAALELLAVEHFDMVLMDVQMPGLDGYDTTRALRERERGTGQRTPVVAATANAMTGDRDRCLAAGMDDYVSKPLVLEELRKKVVRWGKGGPRAPLSHVSWS